MWQSLIIDIKVLQRIIKHWTNRTANFHQLKIFSVSDTFDLNCQVPLWTACHSPTSLMQQEETLLQICSQRRIYNKNAVKIWSWYLTLLRKLLSELNTCAVKTKLLILCKYIYIYSSRIWIWFIGKWHTARELNPLRWCNRWLLCKSQSYLHLVHIPMHIPT